MAVGFPVSLIFSLCGNMESIYTPYHWFFSAKMLNRYTTSRNSTKDCEIQLQLPNSKFIMIPIFEPLILNSHCTKRIVHKNVWEFNLKTIAMTIMFQHSYILDVQILSSNKLKISSTIWLIAGVLGCIYKFCPLYYKHRMIYITVDDIKNEISLDYPIDNRNGNKKCRPNSCLLCLQF